MSVIAWLLLTTTVENFEENSGALIVAALDDISVMCDEADYGKLTRTGLAAIGNRLSGYYSLTGLSDDEEAQLETSTAGNNERKKSKQEKRRDAQRRLLQSANVAIQPRPEVKKPEERTDVHQGLIPKIVLAAEHNSDQAGAMDVA